MFVHGPFAARTGYLRKRRTHEAHHPAPGRVVDSGYGAGRNDGKDRREGQGRRHRRIDRRCIGRPRRDNDGSQYGRRRQLYDSQYPAGDVFAVVVSGVGLQKKRFTNVEVDVDFTTRLDVHLASETIALETIEVRAEAPMIRRDLTSSQATIDAGVIQALPVESASQILSLQAGITQERKGSSTSAAAGRRKFSTRLTAFPLQARSIIRGPWISRRTPFRSSPWSAGRSMRRIHGNALSGIVNTVTKEGGPTYRGTLRRTPATASRIGQTSGRTLTRSNHSALWSPREPSSGPVPGLDQGSHVLSPDAPTGNGDGSTGSGALSIGLCVKNPLNPNDIRVITTGDSALVPMNASWNVSATGKLAWTITPTLKVRYDVLYSEYEGQDTHDLEYNPEANPTGYEWGLTNSLELRHAIEASTYYTVRAYVNINDGKSYLFPLLDVAGAYRLLFGRFRHRSGHAPRR